MKRKYERKDLRKYWLFITEYECVLCGRYATYRERRYDEKPKDWWNRHKRVEYACEEHF